MAQKMKTESTKTADAVETVAASRDMRGVDNLLGIDWRRAWVERTYKHPVPDSAENWNQRARDYVENSDISSYTEDFITLLALPASSALSALSAPEKGTSILDMGCGAGTLALPFARMGHTVIAADLSSVMLEILQEAVRAEGLTGIRCVSLDFNAPWSDWEDAGIIDNCVDIAIASRSVVVDDLWGAFEKLERAARDRIVVTMPTEYSPRLPLRMGAPVDGGGTYIPAYIYAINVLLQMGRYPAMCYIDSDKTDKQGNITPVRWAFITWNKHPKTPEV